MNYFMDRILFKQFKLPDPRYNLNVGNGREVSTRELADLVLG